MNTIPSDFVTGQVLAVLKEAFEGPAPNDTYFADPNGGLLQVVDGLSPAEASREVGNNTIAGQVGHVIFGLKFSAGWVRKNPPQLDWTQSWAPRAVDEAGWTRLRQELRDSYAELRAAITETFASGTAEAVG